MDAKIIAGLLLCFYLMASISISQSASAGLDSRLRLRRQTDENLNCLEGTKPCKENNTICATYCDGNPECEDGTDEIDCATSAPVTTDTIADAQSTESNGDEKDPANDPETTTDMAEATLPQVSIFDLETKQPDDGGATANDVEATATTAEPVTAIRADGTKIVLPPGTTATINADDATTGVAETGEPAVTAATEEGTTADVAAATEEGTTADVAAATEEGTTAGAAATEESTATGIAVSEAVTAASEATTDGQEASTDTVTVVDETTEDSNATSVATVETSTIDSEDDPNENGTKPATTKDEQTPATPDSGAQGELRAVISPDVIQVQNGQTVELTCTVYGADTGAQIYWIQEEPERRYALTDGSPSNEGLGSGSQVTSRARIVLDSTNKIGKYTCSVQNGDGKSASAVVTLQAGGYPPVGPVVPVSPSGGRGYLRIVAPDMADGAYVEIQCEGASPEDEGRIQWYFNNRALNDEQPLYPRGKTLHIRPISQPYLGTYRCSIPNSGYADANTVVTFAGGPPVPTPGPGPAPGTSGQCNFDEATCRNGRCIPRAYVCDGKNDCGDNSDESCTHTGAGGADVCQPNEIRCVDHSRGRKCVQKFWMCDGDNDCDDGTDETPRCCYLLPKPHFCKTNEFRCTGVNGTHGQPICIPRSFQCDGYNDCPDRSDEIGCVKPVIISPPERNIQVNEGQTLTIRCTARGSPTPYINWRLNWGHVCGDGDGQGRCSILQSLDTSDPAVVTGTLSVRNVNQNDAGAYSCEVLNNQGFVFAIPDAIVKVIVDQSAAPQPQTCSCNGHSSYCSPDGRCQNCQHNTAGYNCEFCAPGYQGNARAGTPYDCQRQQQQPEGQCYPLGTHTERDGRCVCKYNVEGDRCDQCKSSHFYLNPTTPNGCLPCFCSGVSSDCTSTSWRRQGLPLSLNNWNAVPKNFATDAYEAGNRIKQLNGGREISLDQSSLGRSADEVLYWKAPKEALGDVVTLYDGNIDVHFTNDAGNNQAASDSEFLWLRGNNIDLVHKIPATQQFKANSNATYSVPVNERTFTRKDGTYIDRENILMALSDLDTLLIKINPIGGKKTAVLRGVTLNVAARDGYADAAPTVEQCTCPANYTGTSCEKCAEGYGRPHPLVGIYLGQCWSCAAICHGRSNQCDRETGKCSNCQGNSIGDRCDQCHSGYVLDERLNQCVPEGQYQQPPPIGPGTQGGYYIGPQPYDPRGGVPFGIELDGSQQEQRVPLRVLNVQPQSVVWGRTDGKTLPPNVFQEGNDLVFRNPSAEQAGNYICKITHPDGNIEYINIQLNYRPGQPGYGVVAFNPSSPLTIREGDSQLIQPPGGYYGAQWTRAGGQPLPSGIYQNGDALQITNARPDQSGTYYCQLTGADGAQVNAPFELRVQGSGKPQAPVGGPPRVSIQPKIINLKEGQRMIVQYAVASHEQINVVWNKLVNGVYQPISSLFTVGENKLILERATPEAAGTYQVVVSNSHGTDRQELTINVQPRRLRQRGPPAIGLQQVQYQVGPQGTVDVIPTISGQSGATITWTKDGSTNLPDGVTARSDGYLRIEGRSSDVGGQYTLDVTNSQGQTSKTIYVQWNDSPPSQQGHQGHGQDRSGGHVDVRFQSRDEQSHRVGGEIHLQCAVHGNVERPYEFTYTKDGRQLGSNVEVHPDGLLIIRNAQASDAGRYQCEVTFPNAPEAGTQESSYDLRLDGGSAGGYEQDNQYGQQQSFVEVTVEPTEATVGRGEKVTLKCHVKGAQDYKVTWVKYAHDSSLPDYIRQEGNNVVISPTNDSPAEQMYLQCQVDVPGQSQQYHAYAPVNIRGGDESSKKKKKRRS